MHTFHVWSHITVERLNKDQQNKFFSPLNNEKKDFMTEWTQNEKLNTVSTLDVFFSSFIYFCGDEPRCVLQLEVESQISKMGEHNSQRKTNTDRYRACGGGAEVAAADSVQSQQ